MHKAHDHSYKLLFSEPQIVIDLLQGFVHEAWVDELDFNTLEKVPSSFRLENAKTPDEINQVLVNLIDWLKSPE